MSADGPRALPQGYELHGHRLTGAPAAHDEVLVYPGERIGDGLAVTVTEFMPLRLAIRVGVLVEPMIGADDAYDIARERFHAEARALGTIDAPGVLRTLGVYRANDTSYRIDAHAVGSTLAEILDGGVTLSAVEVLQILDPLLDGLKALHAAGSASIGVAPFGVLITAEGSPLWCAVGHARPGSNEPLLAGYAPPEAGRADHRPGPGDDIYGLAAVLYRALTGAPPRPAGDGEGAPEAACVPAAEAAAGRARPELLAAIDAALAADPRARPGSVDEWRSMFGRERRRVR